MFGANFQNRFIEQSRVALHIANRDLGKRLMSVALIVWICDRGGMLNPALMAAALIMLTEIMVRYLAGSLPKDRSLVTMRFSVMIWVNAVISIIPYISFSVILAAQPSTALLLAGYMWLFALYVHTANTYVQLPIYNWSLLVPSYLGAFAVFIAASQTEFGPSSMFEWYFTAALMCVYIINTHETLGRQKDTTAALAKAQSEAADRLRQLEHLSSHDPLTELANRSAFDQHLARVLKSNARDVHLFIIDLDDFKPINDTYSHLAGDAVLCELANRLRAVAASRADVARMGGDEFAMLMTGLNTDEKTTAMATRLLDEIRRPIAFNGKQLSVGASIGFARARRKGETVVSLCSNADQAMYLAKQDAECRVFKYDPAVFPKKATLDDRDRLVAAITKGHIRPHYQPKVCLASGRVIGFEALARWHHPTDGILGPVAFLPQIEDFGLSSDLMVHIAEASLRDMSAIQSDGLDPGQISINVPEVALATVSGRRELNDVIDRYPQMRNNLTFEITEDVFIARSGNVIAAAISDFRSKGVRISLDDFGTGFASFSHLRDLEFDELKLDTSFVQGLGVDPADDVLVESFLTIGKGLGVQVVAEGVETKAQRSILLSMGCEVAQGFLFSKAVPLDKAHAFLRDAKAAPSVA